MRILIDTSAYTALMTGDNRIVEELGASDAVLVSPVVMGELYEGFRGGNRNRHNREILARFMAKPRTAMVPIIDDTAEWFAEIKQSLRRAGTPIPINDVWIAASCMEHGAAVLTADDRFSLVPGLPRRPQ